MLIQIYTLFSIIIWLFLVFNWNVVGEIISLDDDYCDDEVNASDEPHTSACSGISDRAFFLCNENSSVIRSHRIPASRVNDGVCDCCDGSDETQSFTNSHIKILPPMIAEQFHHSCPNTCEEQTMQLRKEALTFHRKVQAGKRTRTQLVHMLNEGKMKEKKTYKKLAEDIRELRAILLNMKYLLNKEESLEGQMRFKLLREREHRCAIGEVETACDYFYSGLYNDLELLNEGIPRELAVTKKQNYYEYSPKQIAHLQRMKGIDRVRQSICTSRVLLPDENRRLFVAVGDYLEFQDSNGGRVVDEYRYSPYNKKSTLLARYLDNGEEGYRLMFLSTLEATGLLLSPLILSFQWTTDLWRKVSHRLWVDLQLCAAQDQKYFTRRLKKIRRELRKLQPSGNENEIIDFYGINISVNAIELQFSTNLSTSIISTCKFFARADEEGSFISELLGYLDYNSYSALARLSDYIEDNFETPRYMWEVIWRTPQMYIDYYFHGNNALLPQRRVNCLLRNGIETATAEFSKAKEQLDIHIQLHDGALLAYEEEKKNWGWLDWLKYYVDLYFNTETPSYVKVASQETRREAKREQRKRKREGRLSKSFKEQENQEEMLVDYGPGGDWESLKDVCIKKEHYEAEYNYTFCFFGSITQSPRTVLGTFRRWGPDDSLISMSTLDENMKPYDTIQDDTISQISNAEVIATSNEKSNDQETFILNPLGDGGAIETINNLFLSPAFKSSMQWLAQQPVSLSGIGNNVTALMASLIGLESSFFGSESLKAGAAHHLQQLYSYQLYDHGTVCVGKPGIRRHSEVRFVCDMNNEILEVTEVEICYYHFVISTPLMCTDSLEQQSLRQLEDLGVFGFSSGDSSKKENHAADVIESSLKSKRGGAEEARRKRKNTIGASSAGLTY